MLDYDIFYPTKDPSGTCAYLNRSHDAYTHPILDPSAFVYSNHRISTIDAPFNYTPARHAADVPWPPRGLHLTVNFTAPTVQPRSQIGAQPAPVPAKIQGVVVTVHYGAEKNSIETLNDLFLVYFLSFLPLYFPGRNVCWVTCYEKVDHNCCRPNR